MDRQELAALVDAKREDDPWDNFYWSIVSPQHKYVFVMTGKVASVTATVALRELDGNPFDGGPMWENEKVLKLRDFTTAEIVEMLTDPEWFRFCFVRNPYSRLFSAYKSKIADAGAEDFYQDVQQHIRELCDYPTRDGKRAGTVSFRDFVRYVQSGVRFNDSHWCMQARRLMNDMVPYDVVGRFERFDEDFHAILKHLNAPANVLATASQVRGQSAHICLAAAYDREVADVVYELYEEDFETFGYDRDSWMFE